MSLRDQIIAEAAKNTAVAAAVAARDSTAIAAAMPARIVPKKTAIGKGTILATLGLDAGNVFLDVVDSAAQYRHIKDVIYLEQFDMSLDESKLGVQAMVPNVLTQDQANLLIALGQDSVSISEFEVRCAVWADDGSWAA